VNLNDIAHVAFGGKTCQRATVFSAHATPSHAALHDAAAPPAKIEVEVGTPSKKARRETPQQRGRHAPLPESRSSTRRHNSTPESSSSTRLFASPPRDVSRPSLEIIHWRLGWEQHLSATRHTIIEAREDARSRKAGGAVRTIFLLSIGHLSLPQDARSREDGMTPA